ncbi:hypothetical protein SAMN05444413_101507 [Roseivivax marinus]|uniref:hypothetical protein n=1 Tax=Roseivivax marinus TaxID=1379903 RepID=UPI0008B507EB|nr:hypothetical protein [Roseivivax marinus]SEK40186.1 hypothetical protein SAMN05444413_101507 [Roseivivax marinus]
MIICDYHMTNDAIAAEFAQLNMRLDRIETHMVTKSSVYAAVRRGVATAAVTIIVSVAFLYTVGGLG